MDRPRPDHLGTGRHGAAFGKHVYAHIDALMAWTYRARREGELGYEDDEEYGMGKSRIIGHRRQCTWYSIHPFCIHSFIHSIQFVLITICMYGM